MTPHDFEHAKAQLISRAAALAAPNPVTCDETLRVANVWFRIGASDGPCAGCALSADEVEMAIRKDGPGAIDTLLSDKIADLKRGLTKQRNAS